MTTSNLERAGRVTPLRPKGERPPRRAPLGDRRPHQCLLQFLEQPFVRGVVAKPFLPPADDQRLVLGHPSLIDIVACVRLWRWDAAPGPQCRLRAGVISSLVDIDFWQSLDFHH